VDTKTSGRLNAGSDRYGIAPDFYRLSIRPIVRDLGVSSSTAYERPAGASRGCSAPFARIVAIFARGATAAGCTRRDRKDSVERQGIPLSRRDFSSFGALSVPVVQPRVSTNSCWDWCWDGAYLESPTSPFMPSELVGRPGLDPGTLGLKVPCSSG
jgi:hypothetical protein